MPLSASEIGTSCGEFQREYLYKMMITKDPKLASKITDYSAMKGKMDLYNTKGVFPDSASEDITLKWGGENVHLTGVDSSEKNGTLTFRADEERKCRRFWMELKELGGNRQNHAAFPKSERVFNLLCAMVSVDKTTITDAELLENVQVLKVGKLTADKEGSGVSTFDVDICWDRALDDSTSIGGKV